MWCKNACSVWRQALRRWWLACLIFWSWQELDGIKKTLYRQQSTFQLMDFAVESWDPQLFACLFVGWLVGWLVCLYFLFVCLFVLFWFCLFVLLVGWLVGLFLFVCWVSLLAQGNAPLFFFSVPWENPPWQVWMVKIRSCWNFRSFLKHGEANTRHGGGGTNRLAGSAKLRNGTFIIFFMARFSVY